MERYKRMILALTPDEYDRLVNVAMRQVREPEQQALLYVKRGIQRSGESRVKESVT